jgi:acetyl-CoA/propionyl-CoA carboxylase biotin carboxyl carrier protein
LGEAPESVPRSKVVVEVNGKRLEVLVPAGLGTANGSAATGARSKKPARRQSAALTKSSSGNALTSPMQGTIVKIAVNDGDVVEAGDLVVVLEAMKMEQPLTAHRSGTVKNLTAQVGATVTSGFILCEIVD